MKNNYSAWLIDENAYPAMAAMQEKIKFLIQFSILAPSSHNSQPWEFVIDDNRILVTPNEKRSLAISDRTGRQLYISLGAALENLVIAANYYRYLTSITYATHAGSLTFGARVTLATGTGSDTKRDSHLIHAISRRTTNRNPFSSRMPDQKFIDLMQGLGTPELRIDFVTVLDTRIKLADVIVSAGVEAMDNHAFRSELSEFIISNWSRKSIGMPGFGFGIPVFVSLLTPFLVPYININKTNVEKDTALLREHTPTIVVISTNGDTPKYWMRSGQLFERIALEATKRGMSTHPMAAAVEVGVHYKEVQKLLDLSPTMRPQVMFRLGYTEARTPHSPRLQVGSVLRNK